MLTPAKPHVLAFLVGLAIGGAALAQLAPPLRAQERTRLDAAGQKQWAAVAPGRVEASSREIKIGAPVVGRIAQVLVKPNDNVFAGEVLIRLDDEEALARFAVAEAAVAARERARNDKSGPRARANGGGRRISSPMRNWRLPMRAPHSTRRRRTGAAAAVRSRALMQRAPHLKVRRSV